MKDATITPSELDELFQKFDKAPESYVFVPLADACRKIGRVDEALDICETGIKRHPSYASGYVVRGKCLYDLKRKADARVAFQTVLDLDADNLVALKYLGRIEADTDNFDGARDYFRHILALDPDNKEISDVLLAVEERERSELGAPAPEAHFDGGRDIDLDSNAALSGASAGDASEERHAEPAPANREGDAPFERHQIAVGDGDDATSDESAAIALADIFAAQGYEDRARKIYEKILSQQPSNRRVRQKLDELDGWRAEAPAARTDDLPQQDVVSDDGGDVAAVDAGYVDADHVDADHVDADHDDADYGEVELSDAVHQGDEAERASIADVEDPVAVEDTEEAVAVVDAVEDPVVDELPRTIQLGPVEDIVDETEELDHEVETELARDDDTPLEETVIIMPPPPAVEETDAIDEIDDLDLDVANPDVIQLSDDSGDTDEDVAAATLEVEETDEAIEVTVSEILEEEDTPEGFQEIGEAPEDAIDATPSRTVTTRRRRRKPKPPMASDDGRQIDEKENVQHFRRWINHIAD